ncbi:MAG TPA: YajG family lipoprotein [Gammaproteobacteria bacterium]|nr:YajG family lipoprotein [Gammaproteobacteria bacterium]
MRHLIISTVLLACLIGCAHAPVPLTDIPLHWQPTDTVVESGISSASDVGIQVGNFVDTRSDHAAIGENREDPVPKPVTTRDDVGRFVADHLRETLQKTGLDVVDTGGKVVLSGEVTDFFVAETDVYRSEVTLRITAADATGKKLWSGVVSGTNTRFGHSYRAENYYEGLSDALVDAMQNLLQDQAFRKSLTSE